MNLKEAKKILPKTEFETFEHVLIDQIARTPAVRLKQWAALARKLRVKYQDLARAQGSDISARGTYDVDTSLNDRRSRLMMEIIERIDDELTRPRPKTTRKAVPRGAGDRAAAARELRDLKRRERTPR